MKQYTLGEICTIIKGSTGIKKAIAGDYPLVVTAEERLSSNEYQFDTKAVCIPLVSSTGHGHASLKRIHYQEGKFALGNILAAVIPNDEKQLNAEYLYYYLSFYKDSKIVPLMKGAANVSLTINSIKTIIMEIPDIKIQEKIVETIKKAKCKSNLINKKCFEQESLIGSLKESILLDAVQGKLIPQNPLDEPASELLKRIMAEKEQLAKNGKIKKEKSQTPIAEDEKLFEIPKHWEWISLGDIFQHNTGKALNSSNNIGKKYRYITTSNLYWNKFELDGLRDMYFGDSEMEKYTIKKGDLLVLEGGDIGRAAIWNYDYNICFQNHIHRLRPYDNICIKFFYYLFLLYKLAGFIGGRGIGIQSLSSNAIHRIIFPFPPLAEQQRIVNKIDKLMDFIETLEKNNNLVKERTSNLLKSIEENSLTKYPRNDNNIIDAKEKRAILSAEIISQLHKEQYFGAIKLEKIMYLCETHLKINLGGDI